MEIPPRQEFLMGHSKISSLSAFGLHAPGFKFTVASVDPSLSQLTSSGQEIHFPFFMYEPFSHTHVVLPSSNVVIFFKQEMQMVLFESRLNLPCPHFVHCGYPSSLYFPGGHSPEHCSVVAPEALLNVPPRHILHASNAIAPCVAPHRPGGQSLRQKTTEMVECCMRMEYY